MQDLVNPLPFGKRNNSSQSNGGCSPHLRKSQKIPRVKTMQKEMIPKRAITIGYNRPTKCNVTPEGMLKDIKQNL